MTQWYRRRTIINAKEQFLFASELVLLTFAFIAFSSLLVFFSPLSRFLFDPEAAREAFYGVVHSAMINWYLVLLIVIMLWAVGLVLSHRIWGPLHRLKTLGQEWAKGKHSRPVSFRKHDYLSSLALYLNPFLERHAFILSKTNELLQDLEAEGTLPKELQTKAQELRQLLGSG